MRRINLTESPDTMKAAGFTLPYSHPNAVTFAFSGSRLLVGSRTHPFIFNAIKRVKQGWPMASTFRDYGVKAHGPGRLSNADLDLGFNSLNGVMGDNRLATASGRAWQLDDALMVSFWGKRSTVSDSQLLSVVSAFRQGDEPVWVEFGDTDPYEWSESGSLGGGEIKPGTSDALIDLLIKAHTSPFSLTPDERRRVMAWRGQTFARKPRHSFPTDAEFHHVSRQSESHQSHPPEEEADKAIEAGIADVEKFAEGSGTDVFLSLRNQGQVLYLHTLAVRKDAPPGTGTSVMEKIIELADQHRLWVCLTPGVSTRSSKWKNTTSEARLVRFYRRFGFKPKSILGRYDLPGSMARRPGT